MTNFIELSGADLLVPPGITLRPTIVGTFPVGQNDVGGLAPREFVEVNFRLEYSAARGTYEIASFGLDRSNGSTEISGALWRTVRVHSIVRTAIEMALPDWVAVLPRIRFRRRDGILSDPPIFQPGDPDGLLLAALAYRVAEITDENPALAVAETLGLKQRTATNWIARAREAGYLSTTDHEADGRRIARDLGARIPFLDRPRTPEEQTLHLAHEQISIHHTVEVYRRRKAAQERRDRSGDD